MEENKFDEEYDENVEVIATAEEFENLDENELESEEE